jgi:hypothetical protein
MIYSGIYGLNLINMTVNLIAQKYKVLDNVSPYECIGKIIYDCKLCMYLPIYIYDINDIVLREIS